MVNKFNFAKILLIAFIVISLSGCTFVFQKGRRSDLQKIDELSRQLDDLNRARGILEDNLRQEIKDKQVKLQMMERGLVITVVGDVLFDSGKAKVRTEAYTILDKIYNVLREDVPALNVGIEGHTDNEPIKLSGWKSNWELSTARSLSVLHYLVDEKGISPERISAVGYGEYRPVASNDTKEGRRLNRRVEIVILPKYDKSGASKKQGLLEPQENLK
jgi:chemotaxis protein MotB